MTNQELLTNCHIHTTIITNLIIVIVIIAKHRQWIDYSFTLSSFVWYN